MNARAAPIRIATLIVTLGIGCQSVGPDYERPEADLPHEWQDSTDPRIRRESVDLEAWWKVLEDPVLEQLIVRALEDNLTVRQAAVRILESRVLRAVALGLKAPQVQEINGDFQRVQVSQNAPNTSNADHVYGDFGLGFDVAWELDVWGKFGRGVEATTADLQATVADYDAVLVSVAGEVAAAYVQIRTQERRLAIARQNVMLQERSVEIARSRNEAGKVSELDVAQALTLLNDTKALIPQLLASIRQLNNGLSVLLGISPRDLESELGVGDIPAVPLEVAVGMPADLLRRRPDIRRIERQAAAQCARIGISEAELYPSFSLLGSVGLQTGDGDNLSTNGSGIGDLFESDSFTGLLGFGFSWPVFNYGRLRNDVRAQDARFQQLILAYQDTVLRAATEVEDSIVGYLRSQEQAEFLNRSVEAALRAVEIANIQYTNGAADYQRVLDTQRALSAGQDNLTSVQGEVVLNLVSLYKALGGGWESRLGTDSLASSDAKAMSERTDWGDWLGQGSPEGVEERPLLPQQRDEQGEIENEPHESESQPHERNESGS